MPLDPAIAGLLISLAIGASAASVLRPAGWVALAATLLLVLIAAFTVAGLPLLTALGVGALCVITFNAGLLGTLWLRYRLHLA